MLLEHGFNDLGIAAPLTGAAGRSTVEQELSGASESVRCA